MTMVLAWSLLRLGRPRRFNGRSLDDWCALFHRGFVRCEVPVNEANAAVEAALAEATLATVPPSTGGSAVALLQEGRTEAVRCLAAIACGLHPDPAMERPLIRALRDPVERVRRVAALSLVQLGTVSALAAVVGGTGHGHGVRDRAMRALGEHGRAAVAAIPALLAVLGDREMNWRSHFNAVDRLASLGREGLEALRVALPSIADEDLLRHATALIGAEGGGR